MGWSQQKPACRSQACGRRIRGLFRRLRGGRRYQTGLDIGKQPIGRSLGGVSVPAPAAGFAYDHIAPLQLEARLGRDRELVSVGAENPRAGVATRLATEGTLWRNSVTV